VTVTIEKVVNGGNGLARTDAGIVFVPYSLPSEKLIVEIVNKKKDYSFARIIKILIPSPWRIKPLCPYYYDCGGCQLQHTKYSRQLQIKYDIAKELFGSLCRNIRFPIPSENEFYYRNKVIFRSQNNKVGLLRERTHDIVDVDKCIIAQKKINLVFEVLKEKLADSKNEMMIRVSDTSRIQVNIEKDFEMDNMFVDELDSLFINGHLKYGREYIVNRKLGVELPLFSNSFYQINHEVTEKLVQILKTKVSGDVLLDAYCGMGIFSFVLHEHFERVIGVDISRVNIQNANMIKRNNKIGNCEFYTAKVRNMLNLFEKVDTIIVDPPRKGLSEKVIERLVDTKNERLIYVSCFASTLKRDLKKLSTSYNIDEIYILDMFPQTYHFENIVFMSGKRN